MSFPLRENSFTRDVPSTTLTPRWPLEFERVPAFAGSWYRYCTAGQGRWFSSSGSHPDFTHN